MAKNKTDPEVSAAAAVMGRKGGQARVPKGPQLWTPEERSELARKAAKARWAKVKKAAKQKKG